MFYEGPFKYYLRPDKIDSNATLCNDFLHTIGNESLVRFKRYENLEDSNVPKQRSLREFLTKNIEDDDSFVEPINPSKSSTASVESKISKQEQTLPIFQNMDNDYTTPFYNHNMDLDNPDFVNNIEILILNFLLTINNLNSIGIKNYLLLLQLKFNLCEDQLLSMILNFNSFDDVVAALCTFFVFYIFFFFLYSLVNKIKKKFFITKNKTWKNGK